MQISKESANVKCNISEEDNSCTLWHGKNKTVTLFKSYGKSNVIYIKNRGKIVVRGLNSFDQHFTRELQKKKHMSDL